MAETAVEMTDTDVNRISLRPWCVLDHAKMLLNRRRTTTTLLVTNFVLS